MIYNENLWEEFRIASIFEWGVFLYCKKNHPDHLVKISILARRPSQIPQLQNLIRIIEERGLPSKYSSRAKRRWSRLMQRFRYEDADGLDWVYYSNDEPVLEDDEEIIEKREVIPFVTLRLQKDFGTTQPYEVVAPSWTRFYRTNKRLIFIRELCEKDWKYREFSEGTHIYFSFSLKECTKIKEE